MEGAVSLLGCPEHSDRPWERRPLEEQPHLPKCAPGSSYHVSGFSYAKEKDRKVFIPHWHPVRGAICVKFPAVRLINF